MDTNPATHKKFDGFPIAFEQIAATADAQITDKPISAEVAQQGWNTGDISAYRAAYRKAHSPDSLRPSGILGIEEIQSARCIFK
jgi:hypothetical protein